MGQPKTRQDEVAVIGAGIVGCTVAWALTKAGRKVLLIDRAEPATAGASFGNVGHIATEQLQPLPSPQLLMGFWRELVAFGGVLDIPLHRTATMLPRARCFSPLAALVAAWSTISSTRNTSASSAWCSSISYSPFTICPRKPAFNSSSVIALRSN